MWIAIAVGCLIIIVIILVLVKKKPAKIQEKEKTYYLKTNVKYLRLKNRLSLEDLSSKLKINIEDLKIIEEGSNITYAKVQQLADFFKVPVEELVYRDLIKSKDKEWY